MAIRQAWFAGCLCILFALVAGCQENKQLSMVDTLPNPGFGPTDIVSSSLVPPPSPGLPNTAKIKPNDNAVAVVPRSIAPTVVPPGIPREWVPVAAPRNWRWIVIHHSATPVGGAVRFNREHQAKGWDELGYHFVVGNGTDTAVGQVEVGSRWPKQKWGAHDKTPSEEFNNFGIGICLVGNFETGKPSEAQMKATVRLVAYLMKTYHIPADHIVGHGMTKQTACPGRYLSIAAVRGMSMQFLTDAGDAIPQPTQTAYANPSGELLYTKRTR